MFYTSRRELKIEVLLSEILLPSVYGDDKRVLTIELVFVTREGGLFYSFWWCTFQQQRKIRAHQYCYNEHSYAEV